MRKERILKRKCACSHNLRRCLRFTHSANSVLINSITQQKSGGVLQRFTSNSTLGSTSEEPSYNRCCLASVVQIHTAAQLFMYLCYETSFSSRLYLCTSPGPCYPSNFRSSSSPFEAQVEQRWSLFIRLCGSELCWLM